MKIYWKPFTAEEEAILVNAIADAEKGTSAEIRVHADRYCKSDPVNKAVNIFKKLEMDKTEARNGVLIYISIEDKKFAIIGDKGINELVPPGFWESTRDLMLNEIKLNHVVAGIKKGIEEAGKQLAVFFPWESGDKNELSNDISYG